MIEDGLASKMTFGAGFDTTGATPTVAFGVGTEAVTVTVAFLEIVPPVPVQLTVYVVFAVGVTLTEPAVAFPVKKFVPVHEVALVELQVSVED